MCGRFSLEAGVDELLERYNAVPGDNLSWNPAMEIYPTEQIPVIIRDVENKLGLLKWGLRLPQGKKPVINARVETLEQKRMFRRAFWGRRCLVPADAFFEWKQEGGSKVKYRISRRKGGLFSMAGLYERFPGDDGSNRWGVVIITAPSRGEVDAIHHRMPVIIEKDWEDYWLLENPGNETEDFKEKLLSQLAPEELRIEPC